MPHEICSAVNTPWHASLCPSAELRIRDGVRALAKPRRVQGGDGSHDRPAASGLLGAPEWSRTL
eukprot:1493936-Pleurochrysis_carterae.AAC.1